MKQSCTGGGAGQTNAKHSLRPLKSKYARNKTRGNRRRRFAKAIKIKYATEQRSGLS